MLNLIVDKENFHPVIDNLQTADIPTLYLYYMSQDSFVQNRKKKH